MAEMLDHNQTMNILLSKIDTAARCLELFQMLKPDEKTDHSEKAIEELLKEFHTKRKVIGEHFAKVLECPTSFDTLH